MFVMNLLKYLWGHLRDINCQTTCNSWYYCTTFFWLCSGLYVIFINAPLMFWASYNSGIMVRFSVRRFSAVLREYCQNSSISGLSYLSDMRYHYTERFYWLLCLFLCTCGAYHFIDDALDEFQTDTISMVVESLQPHDRTAFPSIAICEMGYSKEEYDYLEEYSEK